MHVPAHAGKKGYYKRACASSSRAVHEVKEEDDSIFLGTIAADGDPRVVELKLKNRKAPFKIETCAEVTIIPDFVFKTIF